MLTFILEKRSSGNSDRIRVVGVCRGGNCVRHCAGGRRAMEMAAGFRQGAEKSGLKKRRCTNRVVRRSAAIRHHGVPPQEGALQAGGTNAELSQMEKHFEGSQRYIEDTLGEHSSEMSSDISGESSHCASALFSKLSTVLTSIYHNSCQCVRTLKKNLSALTCRSGK